METIDVTVEENVVKTNAPKGVPNLKFVRDDDDVYKIGRETFMEHAPLSSQDIKSYEEYSKEYVTKATDLLCSKIDNLDEDATAVVEIGTEDRFTITVTKESDEPMVITEYDVKHLDMSDNLRKQEALLLAKLKDD